MASIPHQPWFPLSSNHYSSSGSGERRTGVGPSQLITVASALRLGDFLRLRCTHHLHLLLCLHSEEGYHSVDDLWRRRRRSFLKRNPLFLQTIADTFSDSWASCSSFFGGSGPEKGRVEKHGLGFKTSRENSGRLWTNVILALNILVYVAQVASQGKLIMWGAKVNSLIDKGQLWRLATSAFLHANIGHLMVNCYSLNSIGPTVEQLSGPRRFLAVYFTSTLASSLMSYRFCQSPAVGASGAIFGLVGSFAVFVLRHRNLSGGGKQDLQEIARVIALNMVIGLLSRGIDNWGHLGGLLGGAAMSWFLGPAWKYEFRLGGGSIYVDKAPFLQLVNRKKS